MEACQEGSCNAQPQPIRKVRPRRVQGVIPRIGQERQEGGYADHQQLRSQHDPATVKLVRERSRREREDHVGEGGR